MKRGASVSVLGSLALVLVAGCDIGPKLDFDFGPSCTLDCPCRADTECPSTDTCRRGVCSAGACGTVPEPDGPSTDHSADCAQITCSGGKPIYVFDPSDLPPSHDCYTFRCEAGESSSVKPRVFSDPEPDGKACLRPNDAGVGVCRDKLCTRPEDAGADAATHGDAAADARDDAAADSNSLRHD